MPGPPQARVADLHMCPLIPPPPPPAPPLAPFPILPPCAVTVVVGKMPAARMGMDQAMNNIGVPHPFIKGSTTVLINKAPALRIGDPCSLGGMIIKGEFTVLTGG